MAWETRGNRSYYYSARRIDGRVVKEYVPAVVATLAEARDEERREERTVERQWWQKETTEEREANARLSSFCLQALQLASF
ncbi:MAG: hypothetical protein SFU56_21815, partial [Capsulimonadales bacterium]|nr:hypothetical protein [Capsulimonadales bacterium]